MGVEVVSPSPQADGDVGPPAAASPDFGPGPRLLAAVAVLAVLAVVLLLRDVPDHVRIQDRYRAVYPDFSPGVRLLVSPDGRSERCVTCHLAGAGYPPVAEVPVLAAHPDVGHLPEDLGCVPCHRGDPDRLARHAAAARGMDPPLSGGQDDPGSLAWVSCLGCHGGPGDPVPAAWPQMDRARTAVDDALRTGACLGCHRAGEPGGVVGPDLATLPDRVLTDPFSSFGGIHAQVRARLADPTALLAISRMPDPGLGPVEGEILATWLVTPRRPGSWSPPVPLDGPDTWTRVCAGCHGTWGEGQDAGSRPGPVPAVGSLLWTRYVDPRLVRATVEQGRSGTFMGGFRPVEGEPVLPEAAVEAVVDLLLRGDLVSGNGARVGEATRTMDAVATGTCGACHDPSDPRGDVAVEQRRAVFDRHPWRFTLPPADPAACGPPDGSGAPAGEPAHAGEALYRSLCVECHADADRDPAAPAPSLRDLARRPYVDHGYLAASLVLGRPDAPPTRWRHQGVLAGAYGPRDVSCVVRWLAGEGRP